MNMSENKNKKNCRLLGILGGLGPMSSAYYYEMLIEHTAAECDQDHIDIVISSRATTPDRTAFILEKSDDDPLAVMIEEAHKLVSYGADLIAIPCNTAHYFYDKLAEAVGVPILNIIYETVCHLKKNGVKKAGILATNGTILTNTYQNMCRSIGLDFAVPDEKYQSYVMSVIYDHVKSGKKIEEGTYAAQIFHEVADCLFEQGCQKLILGCTELSIVKRCLSLDERYTDSLEVLAYRTIVECGKTPIGFSPEFYK